ncbi:TetR/AcrR family transcriptional regulator [Neoaquamicrobium sediminum]|uniref:TetR/AcrR family transcriptional regulator n=1 Tax=Neoaquamicrobium sediminum TaxID=1849104 RepID=UPI0015653F55|nr:TetR/AcrR family transcriptional regulator [Mesorhizobium sediminum]NRC53956.1 TetR/AcrR family transcriptional regulator [Mesorhizobium sediminum]
MLQPAANAERRDAADAILDAAEAVFADHGFAAATTRAIADLAKVNLALIHYYFRTKEQLFEAVFVRRSDEINDRRRRILAELFSGDRSQHWSRFWWRCCVRPSRSAACPMAAAFTMRAWWSTSPAVMTSAPPA